MRWDRPRARARREPDGKGLLETVTQVAGLLAGLATVVYATGAGVLALRLSFDDLSWADVVPQLPREFVLSIGAGQVLLPSLLIGALYALYRLIRPHDWGAPKTSRIREKPMVVVGINFALMFVPLGIAAIGRGGVSDLNSSTGLIGLGLLALGATVAAIHEARAMVVRHYPTATEWNSTRAAAIMAGIYAAAAIPAVMVGAAVVPLTDAKVCIVGKSPVEGVLVGEASDRVYLGEHRLKDPSLVVLPLSKVEEMFIGSEAERSICGVPGVKAAGVR
jgi:hypothetical protein